MHLPYYPVDQPKRGFTVPIKSWMLGILYDWSFNALSNLYDIFPLLSTDKTISQSISNYLHRKPCNLELIWSLVNLYYWSIKFFPR